MKRLILALFLTFTVILLGACGNTDEVSNTSKKTKTKEVETKEVKTKGKLKAEDYEKLYSSPKKYKGYEVEIMGQIFTEPEKDVDGTYIQFWADPENAEKNTLAAVNTPDLKIKTNDYVIVKGIVHDQFEGENAFGGTVNAPMISADSIEVVDYITATSPTERELKVDQEVNQHGIAITLEKIEISNNQTRVYLKVKNETQENVSFYSHSAKLIVGSKQLEEEYNDSETTGLKEIQSELVPGVETEGVIIYPAIDLDEKSIKLSAEANSDNYEIDFKPFVFDIDIDK